MVISVRQKMILFPPLPLKKTQNKNKQTNKEKKKKKKTKKNPQKTVHVISPVTLISDRIHDRIINNDI